MSVRLRESARPAGFRHPRRFPSRVVRSNRGDGSYARAAEKGWEQGDWTWVSHKRRKALGPVRDGRNEQRQGNGHGGKDFSEERWQHPYGRVSVRSRSVCRDRLRSASSRVRVLHGIDRGRSLTHRLGRPFSCSRDGGECRRTGRQAVIGNSNSFKDNHGLISVGEEEQLHMAGRNYGHNSNVIQVSAVFYINNILDRLLFADLKKGLEVCGIVSDVYLSRFRNVRGQRFGFAKFLKVRDIDKLKKAIKNVFFRDFRLFANVAKFDRFVDKEGGSVGGVVKNGGMGFEGEKNGGNKVGKKSREPEGLADEREVSRKLVLEKVKVAAIRSELEREKERVITVGDVVCDGTKGVKVEKEEIVKLKVVGVEEEGEPKPIAGERSESVYGNIALEVTRKYLPFHEDVEWANKSILAKIKNGLCFSFIQQAFVDAGFLDFKLISMGGDNVLLHPCAEGDVMELSNSAADFVGNFLCDCRPWSQDASVSYERGAWIRCYGVPLHAWNDIFFLELASTRGRLLKIDDTTVNKEKLDYARFLIATFELKELNYVVQFLIDGRVYPIRVIEDLEFVLRMMLV